MYLFANKGKYNEINIKKIMYQFLIFNYTDVNHYTPTLNISICITIKYRNKILNYL